MRAGGKRKLEARPGRGAGIAANHQQRESKRERPSHEQTHPIR